MHDHAYALARDFASKYAKKDNKVLDVGSLDINGTHRPIFDALDCKYTGLDIVAGNNVDIVADDPYKWKVRSDHYDIVISGQTLEHIEYPWETMVEMARVLKPGGYIYVGVPSIGPQHPYPADCWRIFPDGMKALARWAGIEVLHVGTDSNDHEWRTTYLHGSKP